MRCSSSYGRRSHLLRSPCLPPRNAVACWCMLHSVFMSTSSGQGSYGLAGCWACALTETLPSGTSSLDLLLLLLLYVSFLNKKGKLSFLKFKRDVSKVICFHMSKVYNYAFQRDVNSLNLERLKLHSS